MKEKREKKNRNEKTNTDTSSATHYNSEQVTTSKYLREKLSESSTEKVCLTFQSK